MFLDGEKTLEFKLNFKVTKSVKKGFLNLRTSKEELVILDNGKYIFDEYIHGKATMRL